MNGYAAAHRREEITRLHQNAQRLLEPYPVLIPWADQLRFRQDQTRMRRDHAKYLSLIAAITLLRQHQRRRVSPFSRKSKESAANSTPIVQNPHPADSEDARVVSQTNPTSRVSAPDSSTTEHLVATIEDMELANRLASEVLGQSLDGLLPQTRQLLVLIDDHVNRRSRDEKKPRGMIRCTQRELRESLGWSDFAIRKHLARLVELEYVLCYRTSAKNQREYELLYDGQGRDGQKFLLGLTDVGSFNPGPGAPGSSTGSASKRAP
jgi:hypothetical protein